MDACNFFPLTLCLLLKLLFLFPGSPFVSQGSVIFSSQTSGPRISTRLAHSVCRQRSQFQATGVIQRPVTSAPRDGQGQVGLSCGWLDWRLGSSHPDAYQTCNKLERSNGRIVNGQEAKPHQFPYIVTVGISTRFEGCGGSIINDRWVRPTVKVLTALTCRTAGAANTVVAGEHRRSVREGTEQVRKIVKILESPPGINPKHRVSMMKVDPPFTFNEYVQPIALPPRDFEPEGMVTIAGWGSTTNSTDPLVDDTADILQFISIPVIPRKRCQEIIHERNPKLPTIYPQDVCVGFEDGHANACTGDVGSPMVTTINGKVTLVGVAIGHIIGPYCTSRLPFTGKRVSFPLYLDYIAKSIAEN